LLGKKSLFNEGIGLLCEIADVLYSLQQKRLVHFYPFNPFIYQLKKFVSRPCMSEAMSTKQQRCSGIGMQISG
jgi:hypothetical protein